MRLEQVRYLLIDMDGVLYRGGTALPDAADFLAMLAHRGVRYLMVTNNSTATQAEFSRRLVQMGIPAAPDQIMTSAVATAEYLLTLAPAGTKVNVVGETGLVSELERRGFVMAGRDAAFVVCGWDKTINFEKLATATIAIRSGARFIGTNPDKTYPLEHDIIPGAGSLIAALVAATDTQPTIVGKPETIILERSLRMLDADPAATAILGDRLDTDILGGQRAGLGTILVLTGIATAEEAAAAQPPPDLVVADLAELMARWSTAGA